MTVAASKMSSLLRLPRRYRVNVRGSHFCEEVAGYPKPVRGFVTNRWVDAHDAEEATARAFGSVRNLLREQGHQTIANEVELRVEEIEEVSLLEERWSRIQGFAYYEKE